MKQLFVDFLYREDPKFKISFIIRIEIRAI